MADSPIRVRWTGGEQTFQPGAVVRLGRDAGSDVRIVNDNASRRHAEISHTESGWMLRDVGSAQGTWVGGRRTESVPVNGTVSISLGQPPDGEVVELQALGSPAGGPEAGTVLPGRGLPGTVLPGGGLPGTVLPGRGAETSGGAALPPPPPSSGAGTVIVGGSPDRPGGRLREQAVAGATVVTGDTLNLECAGRSYTFQPGQVATIGRDEACDVVSTNPTVSRRHATVRHDGSSWLLEDSGSAGGTFVDGSRVTSKKLSGSTAAWLGPVDTGERIVAVASGPTRRPKQSRKGPLVVVGVIMGVVIFVLGVVALVGASRSSSGPDNDKLARATVSIVGSATATLPGGGSCTIEIQGSGSIIDVENGLILTNAHVVKPTAKGLAPEPLADCDGVALPDPETIRLDVTPGLDEPSEPKFLGEVVGSDGYLDLAVVQITRTLGGRILDKGDYDDLVQVDLGNSDKVKTGTKVNVFGFPGAAQSSAATLSTGVVSGVVADPDLKTNRAYFNVDARISSGNSGGLAADDAGRLIGVPTILRAETVGSIRPIDLARPLISAAQKGQAYTSPYG